MDTTVIEGGFTALSTLFTAEAVPYWLLITGVLVGLRWLRKR